MFTYQLTDKQNKETNKLEYEHHIKSTIFAPSETAKVSMAEMVMLFYDFCVPKTYNIFTGIVICLNLHFLAS